MLPLASMIKETAIFDLPRALCWYLRKTLALCCWVLMTLRMSRRPAGLQVLYLLVRSLRTLRRSCKSRVLSILSFAVAV